MSDFRSVGKSVGKLKYRHFIFILEVKKMDVNHFNEIVRENNRIRDEALESGEITGFNYSYYIKRPLKGKSSNPSGIPSK